MKIYGVAAAISAGIALFACLGQEKPVDFSADIKPILNKKCITCHGGVKAKAGFSVLFREEALASTESGKPAIIPGDPEHSEMIRRLESDDPEQRMPYKHEPLSEDEITLLRRWIRQGAKWGDHWAYLPVKQQAVPGLQGGANEIDAFIREKLPEAGLHPAAPADKATLLRRVSLDLIGTYPDSVVAFRYLNNSNDKDGNNDKAYAQLVDSLLASPRFGERWASVWLDVARYADTKGYESDGHRNIWEYRDWVIRAFNQDMPYNQFLTEQLAGDLLPDPTEAQLIATAFHRNAMSNDEGGTDNEEFRNSANMDRVNSTWEGLMGTTFACVQCHSHPYDPFRHEEYYQFLAYFDNNRDEDVPTEFPLLRHFDDSSRRELDRLVSWVKTSAGETEAGRVLQLMRTYQPAINATLADSLERAVVVNNNVSLALRNGGRARLQNIDLEAADELLFRYYSGLEGGKLVFRLDRADGPVFAQCQVVPVKKSPLMQVSFAPQKGVHDVYVQYENRQLKGDDLAIYFDWFSFHPGLPGKDKSGYGAAKSVYTSLLMACFPGTPIMMENPGNWKRTTHVFERGNRHTPGKAVSPAIPASLRYAQPKGAPANRLGLAQWLTDPRNPLVSRTLVNRLWEQLFGNGIVETLEDMGTQGSPPTHQALLDQLSYRFLHDYGWSIKKLLREMVLSATYRQDARWTPAAQKDPYNKYLARGPRIRLSAEQLRDQDLAVSGLLSNKMYGPGVMPWQPDGIWLSPYNGARWTQSTGENQYRRAVYTYWKRTSPYPSMISFDGAQRVVCSARRIRTNTPLQALTTLNDSAYLDMSRHFALRMQGSGASSPAAQINWAYAQLFFKEMPAAKLATMENLYRQSLETYRQDPRSAATLLGWEKGKEGIPVAGGDTSHLAALAVVANALFNLDETLTKN